MELLSQKAKNIKLAIFDVDGVFTNGKLYYNEQGEQTKAFSVQDGLGIKLLQRSGVTVAIITAKVSPIIETRMNQLGIEHIYQGYEKKLPAYNELLNKLKLSNEQVSYAGDDLPDLPLIQRAGLGIAVANAVTIVQEHADFITQQTGGRGAIREICELIMLSQGTLDAILKSYYAE